LVKSEELPKLKELTSVLEGADGEITGGVGGWMRVGNPRTMLRFLRARSGNVQKAADQYRKAVAYRVRYDIDAIFLNTDPRGYRMLAPYWWPAGHLLRDRDGDTCVYMRLGRVHIKSIKLLEYDTLAHNERLGLEALIRNMHWDAERRRAMGERGKGLGFSIISDLAGLGTQHLDRVALNWFSSLAQYSTDNYPEFVKSIVVVNAPVIFATIWAILSRLLDAGFVAKVQIVSASHTLTAIRKVVPEENIPKYLGGPLELFGDPECRSVISPGGEIPLRVAQRINELILDPAQPGAPVHNKLEAVSTRRMTSLKPREEAWCGAECICL